MKYAPKRLLIAGLLATFGLVAVAQQPATAPNAAGATRDSQVDPARMQQRMARMQERMARHMADFKQKLNLSAGQQAAWNTYIAALQPAARTRPDRSELAQLPTPERIDRVRALRAEHMAEMDKRADATKTFYASLTPEQKKVFDSETAMRGGRHGRGGHHHRGHHMS